MGACGSKTAETAKTAGDFIGDLNPLSAKGDASSRCNAMLREATELTGKLKKAEKELRVLAKAAEAALDSCKAACEAPTPRVYSDVGTAAAAATTAQPGEPLGGPGFKGDAITQAKSELAAKVQAEAFGPIEGWLAKHADAAAKQKLVNKAWDDQEGLKKKLASQKVRVESLKLKGGDAKAVAKADDAEREALALDNKLSIATSKHTEEEAAQHARLVALVEEAAQLGPAMRAALDHVTATLASARDSIGAAPPPAVTVTQPSAPAQAEPAAPSMYPAPPVADAPAAPEQPAPEEPAPTAPLYPAVEK